MARTPATVVALKDVDANLKQSLISVLVADGKTLPEDFVRQTITDAGFTLNSMQSQAMVR